MKIYHRIIALLALAGLSSVGLSSAAPNYGQAADNTIQAQAWVRKVMAENPELLTAGMHAVAPGTTAQAIVASTLNVIGKKSDPPDVDVATLGETIISPNLKVPKLGVMMPLHDQTGKRIGALALAFRFPAGGDPVACLAKAIAIRDQLAHQITSLDALFVAAP